MAEHMVTEDLAYYVEMLTNVPVVVDVGSARYRIESIEISHDNLGYESMVRLITAPLSCGSSHAQTP